MKRAKTSLLLGVTGFIGQNLANYLHAQGEKVVGTYIHGLYPSQFHPEIRLIRCDVTQPKSIERVVRRFSPHHIYYLAAQSSVRRAWLKPIETLQINFIGGVYLLELLRKLKSKAKVLIFSSGTSYGTSHLSGTPLSEEACLRPKDPYGASKMGIDSFARLYAHTYKLHILVVRLANLTGPGQSTAFSIANFASQIAAMETGRSSKILEVGNLRSVRDYLDIRDGVRAIDLAMRYGKRGEVYNIASGVSRSLKDVLGQLIKLARVEKGKIRIRRRSFLIPKDEILEIRLNPSKFMKLTGWKPAISFQKTLRDILEYWRT